jgi:hypothetical protein
LTPDDRITLLRETNATLEAIAQALFKSWFVDFDPVRAKIAGRAPEGMDEATAALFPDALEETELGWCRRGGVCSRPSPDVLSSADQLLSPILDRIIAGALQASALSELRDTLLPRLISGQLRLPDAQAQLEDALA